MKGHYRPIIFIRRKKNQQQVLVFSCKNKLNYFAEAVGADAAVAVLFHGVLLFQGPLLYGL